MCSLGLWVCEELTQKIIHHQVKDAINVLGVTLKVCNVQTHCFCLFATFFVVQYFKIELRVFKSLPFGDVVYTIIVLGGKIG